MAAEGTAFAILELLLKEARVDVNAVNDHGDHAVHRAVKCGKLHNLRMLLDHYRLLHSSEPQAIAELLQIASKGIEGNKWAGSNAHTVKFLTEKLTKLNSASADG
jgi:ankyrin repeat protein